jgi:hypothetical protein
VNPPTDDELFVRLSLLIPAEGAETIRELWNCGEPGVALEILTTHLADDHIPLTSAQRADFVVLARRCGVADEVERDLRWCPDPDDKDPPWKVIEGTKAAPAVEHELYAEIGPDHPLHGIGLTAWLTCTACDDVLLRLDDKKVRAGKAPYACAVVHLTWTGKRQRLPFPHTEIFGSSQDALAHLMRCSGDECCLPTG